MTRRAWATTLALALSVLMLAVGCGKYGAPVRVKKAESKQPAAVELPAEPAAAVPAEPEKSDEEAEPKSQP